MLAEAMAILEALGAVGTGERFVCPFSTHTSRTTWRTMQTLAAQAGPPGSAVRKVCASGARARPQRTGRRVKAPGVKTFEYLVRLGLVSNCPEVFNVACPIASLHNIPKPLFECRRSRAMVLAVSFEGCDRFMAQGTRDYRLILVAEHPDP